MEKKGLGKRVDRAPNFTQNETRLLVKLCLNAKHIIENKQTDSYLWKLKDETWQKICLEFNATSGTIPRTACGLKAKYEGIKKTLKKEVIKNKEESMKTRGGIPKFEPIEGPEKNLLVVLNTQVNGMPSSNDCDSRLLNTDLSGMYKEKKDEPVLENRNKKMVADEMECFDASPEFLEMNSPNQLNENIILEVVEVDEIKAGENTAETTLLDANWSKWNPDLLKTKKKEVYLLVTQNVNP